MAQAIIVMQKHQDSEPECFHCIMSDAELRKLKAIHSTYWNAIKTHGTKNWHKRAKAASEELDEFLKELTVLDRSVSLTLSGCHLFMF